MDFGVYIHFPYCRKRCPYCDFAIRVRKAPPDEAYADAVLHELGAQSSKLVGRRLVSIYFGGGTPSLWHPSSVARVAREVRATFVSDDALEVTLEANPEDLAPPGQLADLRGAGINRLSLGAQSLDDRQLATLGRAHLGRDVAACVARARQAGFDNLSLDLITGMPGQSVTDLRRDLDAAFQLAPDHLSIYNLTVEERTVYGVRSRRGTFRLPDAERQAEMQEIVGEACLGTGYEHYEISSYARPGRRGAHNTLYWSGGEWLGLGAAAHSFRFTPEGGERWSNQRSADRYLAAVRSGAPPTESTERLDARSLAAEAMWLGFRLLVDGVDRARFRERFGSDPLERFAPELGRLRGEGLVEWDAARIKLTARGALFADEVATRFL